MGMDGLVKTQPMSDAALASGNSAIDERPRQSHGLSCLH